MAELQVPKNLESVLNSSVSDGITSADFRSAADIARAIKIESSRAFPRSSLISGLRTVLRKKQREELNAPKEAA